VLGINIGKNKDTPNERAGDDYLLCLERVYPLATYITVNISSPNTRACATCRKSRRWRAAGALLREAQEALAAQHGRRVPMLLKIAPDLSPSDIDRVADRCWRSGIDG
jgi:dihydroorotate dehydrogenase